MFVCICNALKEAQVRVSARQSAGRTSQVYAGLGCKAKCGQCVPFVRKLISEECAAVGVAA